MTTPPAHPTFRQLLTPGRTALGTWAKIASPEVIELIALGGFEFVIIDLEHSPLNLETAFTQIGAAHAYGMPALVRVPGMSAGLFQRILDAGADGLLVPHVDDAEMAGAVVDAARFPPVGIRGFSNTSRAGLWGTRERSEYVRYGQEEVFVIPQVESVAAVTAAGEIASVPGIDAIFIGPADLGMSAGLAQDDPALRALIDTAASAAADRGLPVGFATGSTPAALAQARAENFDFLVVSNDASLVIEASARAVKTFRDG